MSNIERGAVLAIVMVLLLLAWGGQAGEKTRQERFVEDITPGCSTVYEPWVEDAVLFVIAELDSSVFTDEEWGKYLSDAWEKALEYLKGSGPDVDEVYISYMENVPKNETVEVEDYATAIIMKDGILWNKREPGAVQLEPYGEASL